MDASFVNWLAVLAAAASSFLLGGLWYSVLFQKPWSRAVGLTEERLRTGVGRVFGGAAVCALIASSNLAFFIGPEGTPAFGTFAGFAAGFGWVATGLCTTHLFERRPAALIAIDAGYHVAALTLMGLILGTWR